MPAAESVAPTAPEAAPLPESPPAALPPAPEPEPRPEPEGDTEMLIFDTPRDIKLLQQLEEAAIFNRRTLASEILCRLEQTFIAAA